MNNNCRFEIQSHRAFAPALCVCKHEIGTSSWPVKLETSYHKPPRAPALNTGKPLPSPQFRTSDSIFQDPILTERPQVGTPNLLLGLGDAHLDPGEWERRPYRAVVVG